MWRLMTKDSSMATWMKFLLSHTHPASALLFGVATISKTPGGLRKTDEAKAFRHKLLRRPIALRGDTEYIQSNMLGKVVLRYLEEVDDPVVNAIRALLVEMLSEARQLTLGSVATLKTICQEVGCEFHQGLCFPVFCTAVVVLWLALHREKFLLLADILQAAAGLVSKDGRLFSPAVPRCRLSLTPPLLLCVTLSWTACRTVSCPLATICSAPKAPMVVSSLSSGMRLLLTCMLPLTLAALLNGYKASST